MATPDSQVDAFYVLRNGKAEGPVTRAELQAAAAQGQLQPKDLVQLEGYPVWQPLSRILGASEESAKEGDAAPAVPGWRELLGWIGIRLRIALWERAFAVGVVCLAIGTAMLVGSQGRGAGWWVPWFAAAVVAALALLTRWRAGQALALVAGAVSIPFLFMLVSSGDKMGPAADNTRTAGADAAVVTETAPLSAAPSVVAVVPKLEPSAGTPPAPLPDAAAPPPPAKPLSPAASPAPVATAATPPKVLVAKPLAPAPTPQAGPTAAPTPAAKPSPTERLASVVSPDVSRPADPGAPTSFPPALPPAASGSPVAGAPTVGTPEDLIHRHRDAFIVVKDNEGSGSGFICRVGDAAYLFTNIHVVAGMRAPAFTRLDGTSLRPGTADAAAGHDILRFALEKPPTQPLTAISDFANQVRIGDDVVVLGNSGGGGVITSIPGKVVGLGPDRIEVSAEFIPGNSGSPIVHTRTGTVIAVATYLTSRYEEFANSPGGNSSGSSSSSQKPGAVVVRRFGYRLDSVRTWEPVNWTIFRQESEALRKVSLLTEDVFNFLGALRAGREPNFATETLRRPATEWFNAVRTKGRSEADRLRMTQSFLNALRWMVRGDVAAIEGRIRYSFFREDLRQEREVRDRLYTAFDTQARRLASPSQR